MTRPFALPPIGSTVHLALPRHDPGDSDETVLQVPCQVQSVERPPGRGGPAQLVVTTPETSFGPIALDSTADQAVLWTDATGHLELPVIVAAAEAAWMLTATGAPRRVQRREFVRVNLVLPVTVTELDGSGKKGRVSKATMLNLSEGGIRVFMDTEAPPVGSPVVVEFVVGMECVGSVVRYIPPLSNDPAVLVHPKRTFLAVRFDDPEKHGDRIRRIVFAEQLRVRQLQLRMAEPGL